MELSALKHRIRSSDPRSTAVRASMAKNGRRGLGERTKSELDELRNFLTNTGGATIKQIGVNFEWNERKVQRRLSMLQELDNDDPPLRDLQAGTREVIWRPGVRTTSPTDVVDLSRGHRAVVLFLVLKMVKFLEGTGFAEELNELTRELGVILHHEEQDLQNMFHFVQSPADAPYIEYSRHRKTSSVLDLVTDVVDAILGQRQLSVRHRKVERGKKVFRLDPHTLLIYKSGLYVVGYNHHDQTIDGFPLDELKSIVLLNGTFKRRRNYQVSKLYKMRFGIYGGPPTKVRIFFPNAIELGGRKQEVAKYVKRRKVHTSQTIKEVPGGIEVTLQVEGTFELKPWIRSWPGAQILAPEVLRQELLEEHLSALRAEGLDAVSLDGLDRHIKGRKTTRSELMEAILSEWLEAHPLRRR